MMPVTIVGGIWSGQFTANESAAVAVFYGLAVSLSYYEGWVRPLRWTRCSWPRGALWWKK